MHIMRPHGGFGDSNDGENLQKTLANQSGKKASDNFVFNLQLFAADNVVASKNITTTIFKLFFF